MLRNTARAESLGAGRSGTSCPSQPPVPENGGATTGAAATMPRSLLIAASDVPVARHGKLVAVP